MSQKYWFKLELQGIPQNGLLLHRRNSSKNRFHYNFFCTSNNLFGEMSVICVAFQQQKNFDDAADHCIQNNMNLVAIETKEEQDLLRGFLTDNLGSRGSKFQNGIPHDPNDFFIRLEKYVKSFKTSGVRVNPNGQWKWASSKQPLLFRNWGLYKHSDLANQLLIDREKPFTWFNYEIKSENGPYSDYFICESSAPQQEIKQLTVHINAKVKNSDDAVI
jgi:Lectin C-type domain